MLSGTPSGEEPLWRRKGRATGSQFLHFTSAEFYETSKMQDIRGGARNVKTDSSFPRMATALERCFTIQKSLQLGLLAHKHDQL